MSDKNKGVCEECVVPMLGDKTFINAVGSNITEAAANMGMIDLSDEELNHVRYVRANIIISDTEDAV